MQGHCSEFMMVPFLSIQLLLCGNRMLIFGFWNFLGGFILL